MLDGCSRAWPTQTNAEKQRPCQPSVHVFFIVVILWPHFHAAGPHSMFWISNRRVWHSHNHTVVYVFCRLSLCLFAHVPRLCWCVLTISLIFFHFFSLTNACFSGSGSSSSLILRDSCKCHLESMPDLFVFELQWKSNNAVSCPVTYGQLKRKNNVEKGLKFVYGSPTTPIKFN